MSEAAIRGAKAAIRGARSCEPRANPIALPSADMDGQEDSVLQIRRKSANIDLTAAWRAQIERWIAGYASAQSLTG